MKSIKNEIETLKEKEINRLTHSFLENNLDQNNIKALTNIFEYLFGVKESLRLITNILNDKREIKIERNIPKTNRSMSDGNTVKSGILLSIDKMNKNNELKIAISGFKAKKNMFSSNEDVNFKYNLLYNKAPGLQNLYPDSTFLKYNLKK